MRARTICAVWRCREFAVDERGRCAKHRRYHPQEFRRLARIVIDRAQGRCELCGKRAMLTAHHVEPLIMGGKEIVPIDELLAVCMKCQRVEQPNGPARRA